jgi:predicted transcriptional regulator
MDMDVSTIGFLRADRYRYRILETLGSRSGATAQQVSHKLRIHPKQTDKTIKELLEKGLIKADKDSYLLTDEGMKVLAQVSRTGM